MAEDQIDTGEEEPSRRDLFTNILRRGTVAVGVAGLASDLQLPRGAKEYLSSEGGPVSVLLGNHLVGERDIAVEDRFYNEGDLSCSTWSGGLLEMADRSMRASKRRGEAYACMSDGLGLDKLLRNPKYAWMSLPHPDLAHPEEYPDEIYLVSSEMPLNFNLPDSGAPSLIELIRIINSWYHQPTVGELASAGALSILPERIAEGVAAGALIASGLNRGKQTRRRLMQGAGAIAGLELAKGVAQSNAISLAAGELGSYEAQRYATAGANLVDMTVANEAIMLSFVGRTAMAIEKARQFTSDFSPTVPHIDLLYGSAHNMDLPRILTDDTFRIETFKRFLHDFAGRLDTLTQEFDEWKPYRDKIIATALGSTIGYGIFSVNMPWGKTSLDPNRLDEFGRDFLIYKGSSTCSRLESAVEEVLDEFNVTAQP